MRIQSARRCESKLIVYFLYWYHYTKQRWHAGSGYKYSKNVSGVSNSSLQYCCDGSFFSILFAFSAIKRPAKELRLSFMSGEKYVNKIFLLFSGSESAKLSPN